MHTAYLALGSNVGNRRANLAAAVDALARHDDVEVIRVAVPIETEPVDCPPESPPFLNSVVELETTLDAAELYALAASIETAMGRRRGERNAPRPIDLDVLLFDDAVIDTPTLTVPHPRLHERRFVLEPLAEIAPDVVHPTLGRPVRELLDALPA